MTRTLYLLGEPGAGKTTTMAVLTAEWSILSMEKRPLRHVLWDTPGGIVPELGWPRDTFGGTDSLPMDAVRHAEPWVAQCGYPLVLAEGDRLACDRFFKAATEAGGLLLAWLQVPPEVAAERRAQRGTEQNPAWLAGRRTKVQRLADAWPHVVIDATRPPTEVAYDLAAMVAP